MDKKAIRLVIDFTRRNIWLVLMLIGVMAAMLLGEHFLSDALQKADLKAADVCLAVMRRFLQTALSTMLVYIWHKQDHSAAPFSITDIFKLFIPNLLVTLLLSVCVVLIVTLPLAVWLYLRTNFYMNEFITGRSNGVLSCVRSSFRETKGYAGRYLVFNLKFLLLYFLIELAVTAISTFKGMSLVDEAVIRWLDYFDIVFLSVFMPYRYLLQCGFYTVNLQSKEK